jgi:hypothetical protein
MADVVYWWTGRSYRTLRREEVYRSFRFVYPDLPLFDNPIVVQIDERVALEISDDVRTERNHDRALLAWRSFRILSRHNATFEDLLAIVIHKISSFHRHHHHQHRH